MSANPVERNLTAALEAKLRLWELATISGEAAEAQKLVGEVYDLALTDGACSELWDERGLLRLVGLFKAVPPNQMVFGKQVGDIVQRTELISQINDLLWSVADTESDVGQVVERLGPFLPVRILDSAKHKLHDQYLRDLRTSQIPLSEKCAAFVRYVVTQAEATQLPPTLSAIHRSIDALKWRERLGLANVLLHHHSSGNAILAGVSVAAQGGAGTVKLTAVRDQVFQETIERARAALKASKLLADKTELFASIDLPEALLGAPLEGSSVGLGSALAMFSSASRFPLDPFTAYTGDLQMDGGHWVVGPGQGVVAELRAAVRSGCRRVFVPKANSADIPDDLRSRIEVVEVGTAGEVLRSLLVPVVKGIPETRQAAKAELLRAYCRDHGWHLSEPMSAQNGIQYRVSPYSPPAQVLTLYNSGSHNPGETKHPHFTDLLAGLSWLDPKETAQTS